MGDSVGRGVKHKPIRPPTPDGTSRDLQFHHSQRQQHFFDKRKGSVFQRLGGQVNQMNKATNKREEVCRNFQRNGSCPYGNKCIYFHPKNGSGREMQRPSESFQQRRYHNKREAVAQDEPEKSKNQAAKKPTASGEAGRTNYKRKRADSETKKEFDEALQLEQRRQEIQRQLDQLEKDETAPPDLRPQKKAPLPRSPSGEISSNGEVSSASEGEASSSGSSSSSSSDSDSDDEEDSGEVNLAASQTQSEVFSDPRSKGRREEGEILEGARSNQRAQSPPRKKPKLQSPPPPPKTSQPASSSAPSSQPRDTSDSPKKPSSVVASAVVKPPERQNHGSRILPPPSYQERVEDRDRSRYPVAEKNRNDRQQRNFPQYREDRQKPRGLPDRDGRRNILPPQGEAHQEYRRGGDGGSLPSLLDLNLPSPPKREPRKDPYDRVELSSDEHRYRSPPPPPLRDERRIHYDERGMRPAHPYEDRRGSRFPPMREEDRYRSEPMRNDLREPPRWSPGGEMLDRRPLPPGLERDGRYRGDMPGFGIRRSSAERHEEYLRSLDDRTDRHTPNVAFPDRTEGESYSDLRNVRHSLSPRDRNRFRQDDRNKRGGWQDRQRRQRFAPRNARNQQMRKIEAENERTADRNSRDVRKTPVKAKVTKQSREASETESPSSSRKGGSVTQSSPAKEARSKGGADRVSPSPTKDKKRSGQKKIVTSKAPVRSSSQESEKPQTESSGERQQKGSVELQEETSAADALEQTAKKDKDTELDTVDDESSSQHPNEGEETKDAEQATAPTVPVPVIVRTSEDEIFPEDEKGEGTPPQEEEEEEEAEKVIPILDDRLVEISDDELEEEGGANVDKNSQIGADRVDWTSLLGGTKPKMLKPSSVRQRFALHNFLRTVPFSKKHLGDQLVKDIEEICNPDPKTVGESEETLERFRIEHENSWEHLAAISEKQSRKNLFLDKGTCGSALSARVDLRIRRKLCGLVPDFVEPVGGGEIGVSFNANLFELAKKQFEENVCL